MFGLVHGSLYNNSMGWYMIPITIVSCFFYCWHIDYDNTILSVATWNKRGGNLI